MTLHLKDPTISPSIDKISPYASEAAPETNTETSIGPVKPSTTCQLCGTTSSSVQEQRLHVKTDWHKYNLKQKIKGARSVSEDEFEKLVDDLDESISGSGSDSESEADGEGTKESTLSALLKKQAKLRQPDTQEEITPKKRKRGSEKSPLIWFSTSLLRSNTSLGIYRALFTNSEQEQPDLVEVVRSKQLRPVSAKPLPADESNGVPLPSTMTSPQIFLCMIGGGHFAGMIVSLAPKLSKQTTGIEQRQAIVVAHKTFHRYTTRRKQGGGQSANDSAKGAAHSAGSSLRRYNEVALEQEIRALLADWKDMIDVSQLIFIRATGSSNRHILFGPYHNQILRQNDPRNRTFPFSTKRATQAELMRAFIEITRVKVSEVDEVALAEAAAAAASQSEADCGASQANVPVVEAKAKPSKEEEAANLHTTQLQALIRRSKVPALLSYLVNNSLTPNFLFQPPYTQANHHAPTPLHLASSINSPAVVLALLTRAGGDPSEINLDGKTAFDLAGERGTRDAFRVARSELGEEKWDWNAAHIPAPLSKAEAAKRDEDERAEAGRAELHRRKAEEVRLRNEVKVVDSGSKKAGRGLGAVEKTAEERREEDSRGMTPQMRMMVERERRARAAEARLGRR